jgi:cysteine desulfurase
MRSGTLNVPGIVGLGSAIGIAWSEHQAENARLLALRDQLESGLLAIDGTVLNTGNIERMPHVTNIRFEGIDADELMLSFQDELAVASGSACTAADPDPSHVLLAMGLTRDEAASSLRLSLGRQNTAQEVSAAIELITHKVSKLRKPR